MIVVAAGVVGTLLNAGAALLPAIWTIASLPARFALVLPALIVIPSLIAKVLLRVGALWGLVLGLSAVYAIGATLTYAVLNRRLDRSSLGGGG